MSPPAVPGGVAGTFLTFWAVPINCAMGTRAADASPLPSHSLGCLTSFCPHSSYRPEADGQGGGKAAVAFRQGEWLSESGLMASASLRNVLVPAQGESRHPSKPPLPHLSNGCSATSLPIWTGSKLQTAPYSVSSMMGTKQRQLTMCQALDTALYVLLNS